MRDCYDVDRSSRMEVDEDGIITCASCGAPGKPDGDEPTNSGSYFYICSRTGAPLGYSGI